MSKQQFSLQTVTDASSITITVICTVYNPDGTRRGVHQISREVYVGEGRLEEARARARELAGTTMLHQLQSDTIDRRYGPRP